MLGDDVAQIATLVDIHGGDKDHEAWKRLKSMWAKKDFSFLSNTELMDEVIKRVETQKLKSKEFDEKTKRSLEETKGLISEILSLIRNKK